VRKFLFMPALLGAVLAPGLSAQQAKDFFKQNCVVCHTIGRGRLVGPDLKNVTKQKDRAWLEKFIQNPQAKMDSGDAYALRLRKEANGITMPTLPGVTPAMAKGLIDYIESESAAPAPAAAPEAAPAPAAGAPTAVAAAPEAAPAAGAEVVGGPAITNAPFTAADVALGTELFLGTRRLSKKGPPCIACHTLGTLTGLGGGRLGPDLTRVYERLGTRKAVGASLSAPGTSTMRSVFAAHPLQTEEILPLLALIEDASKRSEPADAGSLADFLVIGVFGTLVVLLVMGSAWAGQVRSAGDTQAGEAQRDAQ